MLLIIQSDGIPLKSHEFRILRVCNRKMRLIPGHIIRKRKTEQIIVPSGLEEECGVIFAALGIHRNHPIKRGLLLTLGRKRICFRQQELIDKRIPIVHHVPFILFRTLENLHIDSPIDDRIGVLILNHAPKSQCRPGNCLIESRRKTHLHRTETIIIEAIDRSSFSLRRQRSIHLFG